MRMAVRGTSAGGPRTDELPAGREGDLMAMNPDRLPGRKAPAAPEVAPAAPAAPAAPVPTPSTPAPPVTAPAGEPFTGLDPLTRSLVEAAPLVATTPPPVSPQPSPPTQPDPQRPPRRGISLKQPAFLVALGGTLAAGLLVLTGATRHRRAVTGHPVPAGQGARASTPSTSPILPASVPAPAASWLTAGGSR